MDLELALGRPIGSMPERTFSLWHQYACNKSLPFRRLELLLAQISMLIATTMGGAKDVTLSDFLFDPRDAPDEPNTEDELTAMFGPRKVKSDG